MVRDEIDGWIEVRGVVVVVGDEGWMMIIGGEIDDDVMMRMIRSIS